MGIRIVKSSNADQKKLARAIADFNRIHLKLDPKEPVFEWMALSLKKGFNQHLGGISGYLNAANYCLAIDILWVHENYRKNGYGKNLLKALEDLAISKGARLFQVDTYDFQALDFYQKYGYTLFGKLENCPRPGNTRYYLSKTV